ncbi:MAG: hypothetical protein JO001_23580 [Alphaproteobacteria bacterium]|nr:hypothetical protein [Alphaproteobacteria bacterium]
MNKRTAWIGIGIAAAAVITVAAVVVGLWSGIGDSEITLAGWGAMALGVLLTLALGIGLMSLMFISSRRGYDEPGSGVDRR